MKLKATGNDELVEASPVDKIWGIGLKFDDPAVQNRTLWKGTNYLGVCLEFARSLI